MPSRRFMRPTRAIGAAVALAAALALLAGCYQGGLPFGQPSAGSAPAPAPTVDPDQPFAAFFGQQVEWTKCDGTFECATVTAPLDWENESDTRTIDLALIRHRATGPNRIGSLFVNPGGPGGSGVDFVRDNLNYFLDDDIVASYDVVGWDPRGTGASEPVKCFSSPADISKFLYFVPTVDPAKDPDGWVQQQVDEGKQYADACVANTGAVLEFIDTLSTVRDLELLRVLSGDAQLYYLGYSYGTAIGSIYVDEYPDKVGRVVLDGVVDREASLIDLNVGQQAGFELALTHFVEGCPEFADCPLSGNPAVDLPRIHALLEAFQAHPVSGGQVAAGRAMTGQALKTGILQALYSESSWPSLSTLFSQVLAPKPSTDMAWRLADHYNDFTPGIGFDSSLQDSLWAIYCVDYPVDTDPAVLADQQAQLVKAAPTLTLDLPPYPDVACMNWPYAYRGGQHGKLTGHGAAPVLIVSTTGDPATPYAEGVKLAGDLESGVLLTYDGEGHTAYSAYGDACVKSTVDAYLLDGTVPKDGKVCASS